MTYRYYALIRPSIKLTSDPHHAHLRPSINDPLLMTLYQAHKCLTDRTHSLPYHAHDRLMSDPHHAHLKPSINDPLSMTLYKAHKCLTDRTHSLPYHAHDRLMSDPLSCSPKAFFQ